MSSSADNAVANVRRVRRVRGPDRLKPGILDAVEQALASTEQHGADFVIIRDRHCRFPGCSHGSRALPEVSAALLFGRPYFVPTMQRATPGTLTLPSAS